MVTRITCTLKARDHCDRLTNSSKFKRSDKVFKIVVLGDQPAANHFFSISSKNNPLLCLTFSGFHVLRDLPSMFEVKSCEQIEKSVASGQTTAQL